MLDTSPEIVDLPDAYEPTSLMGKIQFDHVDFYYKEDEPVLQNFNLHANLGETIALVGPTGGGKTTIVNLLVWFFEPKNRLSTVKGADRILFIRDGAITESGTHAELLKARGEYFRLYTLQFRKELAASFDTPDLRSAIPD